MTRRLQIHAVVLDHSDKIIVSKINVKFVDSRTLLMKGTVF